MCTTKLLSYVYAYICLHSQSGVTYVVQSSGGWEIAGKKPKQKNPRWVWGGSQQPLSPSSDFLGYVTVSHRESVCHMCFYCRIRNPSYLNINIQLDGALTGLMFGLHASLCSCFVWCCPEDPLPAAPWGRWHIFLCPKAPSARFEFPPPSVPWGKKNVINKWQMLSKAFISLLVNVQRTFASSNRRQSTSRSVSSEGDCPLMLLEVCGILLVKFPDAGAAPKPNDNHRHTINDYRTDAVTS